jgi:hypothetical protein
MYAYIYALQDIYSPADEAVKNISGFIIGFLVIDVGLSAFCNTAIYF